MDIDSKIKVYLDTSVISYLDQQDAPVEMAQTHQVWEKIKSGKYDVYISDVVLRPLWPKIFAIWQTFSVIAKPVRTLVVAIRIPRPLSSFPVYPG